MIPKTTLFKTIDDFDKKLKELNDKLDKETEETWTIEKFQEWKKMEEAWHKLQDVVEFQILPFTEELDEDKNEVTDDELIAINFEGWEDEMDEKFDERKYYSDPLKKRAYELGRIDVIAGDDCEGVDSIPDKEKIKIIRNNQ